MLHPGPNLSSFCPFWLVLVSQDLIDGFHAQLGMKVNVYLAADSLGKQGETHLVQKLRTKACVSEPFPAPLCPPLRASVHHVSAICRTACVSLSCYKGSESLWTSPKHHGDPCRELEKALFRKCAQVFFCRSNTSPRSRQQLHGDNGEAPGAQTEKLKAAWAWVSSSRLSAHGPLHIFMMLRHGYVPVANLYYFRIFMIFPAFRGML